MSTGWRALRGGRAMTPGSGGSKANANGVQFPTATADWGLITHFGIFDAASGGNLLMVGELSPTQQVYTDDIPVIRAGDIVVNLD